MEQTLGQRLKTLRQQKGLTQEQLADRLLVTRQAVAKWENDNGTPDVDNLMRLADAFGISLDALVGRDNAAPQSPDESVRVIVEQAESASESSGWKRFKSRPQGHLIAGICFLVAWLIWLVVQGSLYDSVGPGPGWALALFAAVASLGAGVINLVRYFQQRTKKQP